MPSRTVQQINVFGKYRVRTWVGLRSGKHIRVTCTVMQSQPPNLIAITTIRINIAVTRIYKVTYYIILELFSTNDLSESLGKATT